MNISEFSVKETDAYKKSKKSLLKRFRQLDSDVREFLEEIEAKSDLGTPLGKDIYKARIANSDKSKGKSAGYRLITLLKIVDNQIHLLYIYDKSDLENISENDMDYVITQALVP